MLKDYDIVGSYNNERYLNIDAERTVNMCVLFDKNSKKPKSLLPTSGIINTNLNFTPETGGARGSFVFKGVAYQVFGGSVYLIRETLLGLTYSKIGSLTTNSGYVGIDANTYQVIFVDGQQGWIWDINASTFTQITDSSFPARPIDVTAIDGFFLVANGDTNQFNLSMLEQGMVWSRGIQNFTADSTTDYLTMASTDDFQTGVPFTFSTTGALPTGIPAINNTDTYYAIRDNTTSTRIRIATSYANAIANIYIDITANGSPTNTATTTGQLQQGTITSYPGNIVACRSLHRRVFLFSEFFTEVWENAGVGTNLPLRRNNALLMELGTVSAASIAKDFGRMIFVSKERGGSESITEVRGTQSIPASNKALDYQLSLYAKASTNGASHISDARGMLTRENGIIFYRLNFTLANKTFVLNVSFSTTEDVHWHEEEVLNGDRHPAQTHFFYNGTNYYGDYRQAKLYRVDTNEMTNDGEPIRRMRIGKPIVPEGYNRIRVDRYQLDVIQGNVDEEILNPQVLLTQSQLPILTEDGEEIYLQQQVVTNTGQPVVFFSYSKDGGITYGSRVQAKMGNIGERTYRTLWRKLGTIPRGQAFVPKIEFFNKVPFVILGAAWDFEILPE